MTLKTALIAAVIACLGRVAAADTQLAVQIGWGDKIRGGYWTPIFVRVSDPLTRAAKLELYVPQGGSYAMQVEQYFTLGPNPSTFPLYAPVRFTGSEGPHVVIRDADTNRTLAHYPDDPDSGYGFFSQRLANSNSTFIGVSGARTTLQLLRDQFPDGRIETGYLEPELLPAVALGYDGLDVLILNRPDLLHLDIDRQRAILDWVRAGGSLLLWPGDDPAPQSGPLIDALPCRIEGSRDVPITKKEIAALELEPRFTGLRGRVLTPAPDATSVALFASAGAFRRQVGLGQIVVAPADLSQLQFTGGRSVKKLWEPMFAAMGIAFEQNPETLQYGRAWELDPAAKIQSAASTQFENSLGDVPGAGRFGFSYVALVLLGMMVVVGPVDWFVLRKLGRQPWTWVTTSGWITLVTLGAVFIGHVFKSGNLYYRTVQVVDQADGQTVGEASLACIYSPRTTMYHLDAPAAADAVAVAAPAHDLPAGWWQPASGGMEYGYGSGSGMKIDLDFHQTYEGNAPEPLLINVWNLRFLRADALSAGPAVIEASLSLQAVDSDPKPGAEIPESLKNVRFLQGYKAPPLRVVGKIKNLSDQPLTNVRIRTPQGFAVRTGPLESSDPRLTIARIEPHASADVDLPIGLNVAMPGADPTASGYNYRRYSRYEEDSSHTLNPSGYWALAGDLAGRRSQRIDALLAGGGVACIYAECETTQPPAALREPGAIQKHWKLIRAVVPLGGDRLPPSPTTTPVVTPMPAEKLID